MFTLSTTTTSPPLPSRVIQGYTTCLRTLRRQMQGGEKVGALSFLDSRVLRFPACYSSSAVIDPVNGGKRGLRLGKSTNQSVFCSVSGGGTVPSMQWARGRGNLNQWAATVQHATCASRVLYDYQNIRDNHCEVSSD